MTDHPTVLTIVQSTRDNVLSGITVQNKNLPSMTRQSSSKKTFVDSFWSNRRVLVAGGTQGFGFTLARQLVSHGANVMLVGRSSAGVRRAIADCEAVAGQINKGQVRGLAADLNRAGEGDRVVAGCLEQLGGLDTLLFCIGQSSRTAILKVHPDTLRESVDANLFTAIELSQAAAEPICRSAGRMVYIGSLAGKLVTPGMAAYAVGKSALAAFVDAIRLEVEPLGVRVLLVSPGPILRQTNSSTALGTEVFQRYDDDIKRHGLPKELAQPGGGASIRRLDPEKLAAEVLEACRRGVPELTRPRQASILAGIIELFPTWGRQLLYRFTKKR